MKTDALDAAFRATTYRVETDQGAFYLRIDERNPEFAAYLGQHGVTSWCILTACNPRGRLADVRWNASRNEKLLERIGALGLGYFHARNHADSCDWPVETGYCILDVCRSDLFQMAEEFEQAAVVWGTVEEGKCHLGWTECSDTFLGYPLDGAAAF